MYVCTGDAGGAVDEDEDHAAEGPCDAEDADAVALVLVVQLVVADRGGDADVEEEQSGDELGDDGSVERPELELGYVDQRRRWWVHVVLPGLPFFAHFFRHLFFASLFSLCSALSLSLSFSEVPSGLERKLCLRVTRV